MGSCLVQAQSNGPQDRECQENGLSNKDKELWNLKGDRPWGLRKKGKHKDVSKNEDGGKGRERSKGLEETEILAYSTVRHGMEGQGTLYLSVQNLYKVSRLLSRRTAPHRDDWEQNLPHVMELQSQVIPVLLIWGDNWLEGTREVPPPVVTQVHHAILAPAQLLPQFRFTCKGQRQR